MKLKNIIALFVPAALFVACNYNVLPDELFRKTVLLNQNGFQEYDLPFVGASIKDTTLSIAVNGSSTLDRDVKARIEVYPDTLAGYNWEQFRSDESLYYTLLPEECYEFSKDFVTIKAGDEYTTFPIRFYLDEFDRTKHYILPLRIAETTEYPIADSQYSTVLMSLVLSNAISGTYSVVGSLQEQGGDGSLDVQMSTTLKAVDNDVVSMYASNTSEKFSGRENMLMYMQVNADSTLTFTSASPTLTLKPAKSVMDEKTPCNRYFVKTSTDVQNSHKKYVLTTFYVKYQYVDASNPDSPVTANWTATISRTKVVMTK